MPYALTPLAKADIFEIWSHIAEDNEDAADRVERAIYDACAFVAEAPMRGHCRPDRTTRSLRFERNPPESGTFPASETRCRIRDNNLILRCHRGIARSHQLIVIQQSGEYCNRSFGKTTAQLLFCGEYFREIGALARGPLNP